MSWRTTWFLFSLAVVLFAFIYLVERRFTPGLAAQGRARKLIPIRPVEITALQLRRTNQFVLKAERTKDAWNLTAPVSYPAQVFAVEALLKQLAEVSSQGLILPDELASGRQTVAEFGLDVPMATLTLMQGTRRLEVSFGHKTPPGDQVYVQLLNSAGIHVVPAEVFDHLPHTANEWRDNSLVNLAGLAVDRVEVRMPNRGFGVAVNATDGMYHLFRPANARADAMKVHSFLRHVQTAQVLQFVNDDPRADGETYGLGKPETELVFGVGTNDAVTVQFGKSPPGNSELVYARRMTQTNVVLVPKAVLETLQINPAELRDRHLFSFAASDIDTLELAGAESFAARRQNNSAWVVIDAQATLLDGDLVEESLKFMGRLEGNVEKDLVTDFASYGLTEPARRYFLKTTLSNSSGTLTNRVVASLDVGARQGDKVFVRRGDEKLTVYSISTDDIYRLPIGAWQLRDRRVWSFSTNQVTRLFVRHGGINRELLRSPNGEWSFAVGSTGMVKTPAVEELVYQLGQLRAYLWVARGDEGRARYGFTNNNDRLAVELKAGDKTYQIELELGGFSPVSRFPYAATMIDGQSWIFEFPADLFWRLQRDLITPLRMTAGL